MAETLSVLIRNQERVVYKGEVMAVSSFNDKGPFDILPRHANFISLVFDKVVVWGKSGEKKEMAIEKGVLSVFKNEVNVYLGAETLGV